MVYDTAILHISWLSANYMYLEKLSWSVKKVGTAVTDYKEKDVKRVLKGHSQ